MWQHVKLSDVSLETRPRYSPGSDEGVKKQTKKSYFFMVRHTLFFIYLFNYCLFIFGDSPDASDLCDGDSVGGIVFSDQLCLEVELLGKFTGLRQFRFI